MTLGCKNSFVVEISPKLLSRARARAQRAGAGADQCNMVLDYVTQVSIDCNFFEKLERFGIS